MQLLTWIKRIFSDTSTKPPPHKQVRTKALAAQQRLSEIAAKESGRPKIKSAKFGTRRPK
jgi:hypothetical protein